MTAPILIFGWGNPSRGDDALGPLFIERMEALNLPGVECLTDFQLQVEHALDLRGRQRALFVDASLTAAAPFELSRVTPARDKTFTSHAMSPAAVLQTYADVEEKAPPECWLLAIRGEAFELGEALSPAATQHLAQAVAASAKWLTTA